VAVVLIDPRFPDAVPAAAAALFAGAVAYTPDVPEGVRRTLAAGSRAVGGATGPDDEPGLPLVTASAAHPAAAARAAAGEAVLASAPPEGVRLLDAVALMDRLRSDGPWEAAQTHSSLTGYLVEETYELLDAIESGDRGELIAELGDVLLQVLFHARIGEDFTVDDVADSFIRKVSARSAGVLAGGVDMAAQVDQWERAKSAERPDASAMDGIPAAQPALALAAKIVARARGAGVPPDLVPAAVTTVAVDADGGAEERLRSEALAFARRIRAAEQHMRAARRRSGGTGSAATGDRGRGFSADEWRAALTAA